jgi:DNA-directed RNA polymerase specialized sigma24 family protein
VRRISQYEYLLATTPAPESEDAEETALALAASMTREALRLVAQVALGDAVDGGVLLGRMAGMSLAEIGQRLGMSKQAVHKRVRGMARAWPPLAAALTGAANPLDETVADQDVLRTRSETERIRQEATRWMNRPN